MVGLPDRSSRPHRWRARTLEAEEARIEALCRGRQPCSIPGEMIHIDLKRWAGSKASAIALPATAQARATAESRVGSIFTSPSTTPRGLPTAKSSPREA